MAAKNFVGKMPKGNEILGNLKNLGILSLFVIGIVLMLSGSVNAYNNLGNGICECSNCSDCTNALNDSSCTTVKLNADIINQTGTCINNPQNFTNKIFDCQGHTIDGDKSGWDYGIYIYEQSGNTIKNCVITDFSDAYSYGIYIYSSSHTTLTNNTVNNNYLGIYLFSSSNNILTNNTANNNEYQGIDLVSSSNNNALTNNTVNNNTIDGILLDHSSNNTLTNNAANNNKWNGISLHDSSNYNTLTNNTANNNIHGICLDSSSNFNTLTNNTVNNNNQYGIYLYSSPNNTLTNNTANNNKDHGIYLYFSSNNFITNNTLNNNSHYGIYLYCSSNSIMRNNTMRNNTYNFGIEGNEILDFYQDIDTSNLVDNKHIYYWTNEKNAPSNCKNAEISELNNTGFVALVFCNNITVKNLNLHNNSHGILLVNTTNSKILNNTANNNDNYGIYLDYFSNYNTITNNTANNNTNGIYLHSSPNNTLTNNTVNNNQYGIYLDHSLNNTLTNNTANNNKDHGIDLDSSSNNTLTNNTANNNGYCDYYYCYGDGISLYSSSNNTLTNNTANNNHYGIYLWSSSNNTLNGNHFCSNSYDIYWVEGSGNTGTNFCEKTYNWNDNGVTGCAYSCSTGFVVTDNETCIIKTGENCTTISQALKDARCKVVKLNSSVLNWAGTCINNPPKFNNKTLDCRGYTIDGTGSGDGIYLDGKSNNTIKNCVITDFDNGIYLYSSSNNTLTNNTANNNNHGIHLSSSSKNNSIEGNEILNNKIGIFSQDSTSTINNNYVCGNIEWDLYSSDWLQSFGDNKCDKISGNNNSFVLCTKNCSSPELPEKLVLYYCDYDNDSYLSKSISGYCFGYNESCIPAGCSLNKGNDCNDNNSTIHPNAGEIICNGIDENCDGFDKCNKRIWSSDENSKEKNTFYSYQNVYITGTGFDPNKTIDIYIIPCQHSIPANLNLTTIYKKKYTTTTDINGNFIAFLWHLPGWWTLPTYYYDIIADENLNGIYDNIDTTDDGYHCGFYVDPVWASDENGNLKETFCENEKIYVNGAGLPVNNTNLTVYFVPHFEPVDIIINKTFCDNGNCINVSPSVQAEIGENGNFKNVVLGWNNPKPGEYDVIPDLNHNGKFDGNEKDAMGHFTVGKKFDFDNNNDVDIFDAVNALENLSEGKEIYNTECSDTNNNGIDLADIFYLMERIVIG